MTAPDNLAIEVSAERIAGGVLEALGNAIGEALGETLPGGARLPGDRRPGVAVWRRGKRSGAAIVRFEGKPAQRASLLGLASDGERGETRCYELPSEVCEWLDVWHWPEPCPIRFSLGEALPGDHPLVAWLIETRALDEGEIGAAKEGAAR